jgi:hypothetical protein
MQHRFLLKRTQNFKAVVLGQMQVKDNDARQGIVTILTLVLDECKRALAVRGDLYVNRIP